MDYLYIKNWLSKIAFANLTRKDGITPMANHSIEVGQYLELQKEEPCIIFAGYFHDVIEDCAPNFPDISLERLVFAQARIFFTESEANRCVYLVKQCSYTPEEYEIENYVASQCPGDAGKLAGKLERETRATERWLNSSHDVRIIKEADVRSNNASCDAVSPEFAEQYRSWAMPFLDGLVKKRMIMETPLFKP